MTSTKAPPRSPTASLLLLLAAFALLLPTFRLAAAETYRGEDDPPSRATIDLFNAALKQDVPAMEEALANGADIDARSPANGLQTPLMSSVLNGKEDSVRFLLGKGADVTIGEKDGYTPMHGAGFQGRAAIAKLLSDAGVGLRDKHEGDGHEPAIRACWGPEMRHTETVRFFLESGVPLEDIYEACAWSTRSPATKELLNEWKRKSEGGGEL